MRSHCVKLPGVRQVIQSTATRRKCHACHSHPLAPRIARHIRCLVRCWKSFSSPPSAVKVHGEGPPGSRDAGIGASVCDTEAPVQSTCAQGARWHGFSLPPPRPYMYLRPLTPTSLRHRRRNRTAHQPIPACACDAKTHFSAVRIGCRTSSHRPLPPPVGFSRNVRYPCAESACVDKKKLTTLGESVCGRSDPRATLLSAHAHMMRIPAAFGAA